GGRRPAADPAAGQPRSYHHRRRPAAHGWGRPRARRPVPDGHQRRLVRGTRDRPGNRRRRHRQRAARRTRRPAARDRGERHRHRRPGMTAEPARATRAARTAPVRPKPLVGDLSGSLRLPAFWLLVGLLLVGAVQVATMVAPALIHYPRATSTAI